MGVSKIFKILVTIVLCVVLGAFILNKVMPNTVASMFNAVDGMIYNATGISMDLNGDGRGGKAAADGDYTNDIQSEEKENIAGGVAGFGKQKDGNQ